MLFASVVAGVMGSSKRSMALANFCGACQDGTVNFTPDENTDKIPCESRERQRLLSMWYANKFSSDKKVRAHDLLEAITTGARKFCEREWSNKQCKKHCGTRALPSKAECKNTFRYRELHDRTVFLCPRRFDLRSVTCIHNAKNSYEFVVSKCHFCQKLLNDGVMNAIPLPKDKCCTNLQICEKRSISRKWSTYASICNCWWLSSAKFKFTKQFCETSLHESKFSWTDERLKG